ncbi:hypothetical protein HMPREF0673_02152 [Leyella stercorea DSM 18206]|uniref:Uncharacterized protein n=1 Tax=Leyella stercorea DSM 18206 TaxID=1002367 RepID=G6AZT5_9BACT|nr:hypothetical protein HMPREF0673_02152 [Leyella stercorea DSM 18206]
MYGIHCVQHFEKRVLCAFKGVHLSPLGFAACQSKKCTNRARGTPFTLLV